MTDATTTDDLHDPSEGSTRRSERGASLVEYALLLALIAVIVLGGIAFLGSSTDALIGRSGASIVDATG